MYAEYFSVRPWLEEPAKWLQWAAAALNVKKDKDAEWNLQQFWKALDLTKKQAAKPQDWEEITRLDARSKLELSRLLQMRQTAAMQGPSPLLALNPVGALVGAYKQSQAVPQSAILAIQANKAAAEAKAQAAAAAALQRQYTGQVSPAAAALLHVATTNEKQTTTENKQNDKMRENSGWSLSDLGSWMGVPVWAWALGGLALVLLLSPAGQTVISYAPGRRRE